MEIKIPTARIARRVEATNVSPKIAPLLGQMTDNAKVVRVAKMGSMLQFHVMDWELKIHSVPPVLPVQLGKLRLLHAHQRKIVNALKNL